METVMLSISIFFATFFSFRVYHPYCGDAAQRCEKKRKVKKEIREHGNLTLATIKRAFSRSGGNSGYINATLELVFGNRRGGKNCL